MNPLFQVGEKIRLISRSHPEYNGEYFVERVVADGEIYTDRLSGVSYTSKGLGYFLDVPLLSKRYDPDECKWLESALRKIYPPSTESFDEMVRNIKQNNLVEEFV